MRQKRPKQDCPHKNKCKAPICPLDEESQIWGVWLPNGEILSEVCRNERLQNHPIVRGQHVALEKGIKTCLTATELTRLAEGTELKTQTLELYTPETKRRKKRKPKRAHKTDSQRKVNKKAAVISLIKESPGLTLSEIAAKLDHLKIRPMYLKFILRKLVKQNQVTLDEGRYYWNTGER